MKSFAICTAFGALIALAGAAHADSIVDPSTDPGAFVNAGSLSWYVPCDFEYGASAISGNTCGGDFEIDQSSFGSILTFPSTGATDNVTFSGVSGSVFAFQEVDTFDPSSQQALEQVDSVIADNAQCIPGCFGPITFSFSSGVTGMFTDIYSQFSFDASVTAYDAGGNVLGSTSYTSTEYDNLLYFSVFNPTYSAAVGVLDTTAADIASIVISTTPTTPDGVAGAFGIGGVAVAPASAAPEPSTFFPIGACLVVIGIWRRARRGSAQ